MLTSFSRGETWPGCIKVTLDAVWTALERPRLDRRGSEGAQEGDRIVDGADSGAERQI